MPLHKSLLCMFQNHALLITDLVFAGLNGSVQCGVGRNVGLPAVVRTAILSLIGGAGRLVVPCSCGTLSNFHWLIWYQTLCGYAGISGGEYFRKDGVD